MMDMQLLCYKERLPTNIIYRKTPLYFQSARKFEKYFSLFAQTGPNLYLRAFLSVST